MTKKSKLQIVADEKIPFVKDAFSHLGTLHLLPGRSIEKEHLKNADLILVRSVTKISQKLLEATPVKMVASATIGTDHVDLEYLSKRQIKFAFAKGGNARSAAEYVMTAIIEFAVKYEKNLNKLSLGVVGVGNIGSIVVRMAEGLGLTVLKNDPPLAEKTNDDSYLPLDELLKCDIVTVHVPLTQFGYHKTVHLFNSAIFDKLQTQALLINTSRGAVVDQRALLKALGNEKISAVVLDVWENEPNIDLELLDKTFIATPHIAGYSQDGKAKCAELIYREVCEYFGFKPTWQPKDSSPEIINARLDGGDSNVSDLEFLQRIVKKTYDIEKDDLRMRSLLTETAQNVAVEFDRLRNNYPVRREFWNYQVAIPANKKSLISKLQALGFKVIVQ